MLTDLLPENGWWEGIREELRLRLGGYLWGMWFSTLIPGECAGGRLTLRVPSQVQANRLLREDFHRMLSDAFRQSVPGFVDFSIEVDSSLIPEAVPEPPPLERPRFQLTPPTVEAPRAAMPPFVSDFRFDTFVEGESNRMAMEAARTVAQAPGCSPFNPLVLFGGTGLGKTHLLHALGSSSWECRSAETIHLTNSDKLLFSFSAASKKRGGLSDLFRLLGKNELILIDDVQFFAGKKWMEEQFGKLVGLLHRWGRQVVVTSDRPIAELPWLDPGLTEGFRNGLAVEISPPDCEHRLEILRAKNSESDGLSDEVLEFVAENFSANVRELEGVLLKLYSYRSFFKTECTVELAGSILSDHIRDHQQKITIEMVAEEVAHSFGVTSDHLKSASRRKEFSLPRQVAMYLSYSLLDLTLHTIGIHFNRDYSTVQYSIKNIEALLGREEDFAQRVDQLRSRLSAFRGL